MHEFEFDTRMAISLREMDTTGMVRTHVLHPSLKQYDMQPGQKAAVVTTDSEIDQDFTLLTMLDPGEYEALYPDWQARFARDYRLCEWKSAQDTEGSIGWFQLGRIIPLDTEEHFEELMHSAVLDHDEHDAPEWLTDIYSEYLEGLQQVDPDQVYGPIVCPHCNGKSVEIHVRKTWLGAGSVGSREKIMHNGNHVVEYGVIRSPRVTENMEAHLHCPDCEYRGQFTDEEITRISIQKMDIG